MTVPREDRRTKDPRIKRLFTQTKCEPSDQQYAYGEAGAMLAFNGALPRHIQLHAGATGKSRIMASAIVTRYYASDEGNIYVVYST